MSEPELERWNSRYAAPDYLFGTAPNAFLAAQQNRLHAGQRALCVADGEGRNSVWLAEQGLEVTAFDFSPAGAEKARRLAAQRGVRAHYDVSTVYDWPWPESAFDVVAAIFVQFADPPMRDFMFERMVRALVPGGLVFLIGYTPKQRQYDTGGPKQVDQLYTEPMLREAFKALEILELREYEADLAEGSRHQGRSALIHLVARKKAGMAPMRTIAGFEAAKGVIALAAGFGLLGLLPHAWRAVAHEIAGRLHLNPAKGRSGLFLRLLENLADARLWVLAALALAYSAARFTEAYGLWRARRWAQWFAALSGGIYIPFELYALSRGVSAIKLAALLINVAVVAYMVRALRSRRRTARTRLWSPWGRGR